MITSLFFQCYYAFLKGNLPDAEMYYQFLKEEFKHCEGKHNLTQKQLKILKTIRESIKQGKILDTFWTDPIETKDNLPQSTQSENNQKQLIKEIHTELHQIENLLHPTGKLRLTGVEYPCPPYGILDVLYEDNANVYPLEIKTGIGKHDVIGQIAKYDRFFRFKLHLKLYEEVKPITLCAGYHNFTLEELKKRRIITLKFERANGILKLYKI